MADPATPNRESLDASFLCQPENRMVVASQAMPRQKQSLARLMADSTFGNGSDADAHRRGQSTGLAAVLPR